MRLRLAGLLLRQAGRGARRADERRRGHHDAARAQRLRRDPGHALRRHAHPGRLPEHLHRRCHGTRRLEAGRGQRQGPAEPGPRGGHAGHPHRRQGLRPLVEGGTDHPRPRAREGRAGRPQERSGRLPRHRSRAEGQAGRAQERHRRRLHDQHVRPVHHAGRLPGRLPPHRRRRRLGHPAAAAEGRPRGRPRTAGARGRPRHGPGPLRRRGAVAEVPDLSRRGVRRRSPTGTHGPAGPPATGHTGRPAHPHEHPHAPHAFPPTPRRTDHRSRKDGA
ncbi:putative tRNA-dihydrouridine synthase DusB [Streptomyces misionensis JCM 4497]